MDQVEEELRDLFAAFGQATFLAQKLEGEVTNALVALEFVPHHLALRSNPSAWGEKIDEFFGICSKQTMGTLIRRLSAYQEFYLPINSVMEQSLKVRNFLSHHFVRQKSEKGLNSEGRKALIQHLRSEQAILRQASQKLESAIQPVRNQYIPIDEKFLADYKEYLESQGSDL